MRPSEQYRRGILPGESGAEYNARATGVLKEAIGLSREQSDGYTALNKWMIIAKAKGMTWLEGLYFAFDNVGSDMKNQMI
jgi:hypothetical protein